ncbi:MAG: hypothetical protein AAFZ11_08190 [Pseudomonadota bacterium]
MIDEPPPALSVQSPAPAPAALEATPADPVDPFALPTTTKSDGTVVIDLIPLAPAPQMCAEEEPDPFNPEIVVCRKTEPDPRIGPNQGPSVDELLFASAVPRARLKLSENAEAEANTIKKPVGGFNADGVEARVKIEF